MKRGGPLPRRTPLDRGTSQLKRTPMRRGKPLRSTRERTADEWTVYDAAKAAVRARSRGRCEARVSRNCTGDTSHGPHHVIPQGPPDDGPDTAENLLDVCGNCHGWIHDEHPADAERLGLLDRSHRHDGHRGTLPG